MFEYDVREIQLALLELAKEFKRVCDANGLKYIIDSGTLLGAVRHGGFIPWDDDVDFAMLRQDYERLLEIAPYAFGDNYFLQTWDNDPYYPYGFAKLRKKGTRYRETALQYNLAHDELFVDVFPYDSFPERRVEQIKQGFRIEKFRLTYMMKQNVKPWLNHERKLVRALVYLKYLPYRIFASINDENRILELYKREMTRFNTINTPEVYPQAGAASYGKWIVDRFCFTELVLLKFEDTCFLAPKDYDKYLKRAYGDYMKLPPINKRENKHRIIEVIL